MHLICASQLHAMGSKRRIWLPDVLRSSCSKFLSQPRPSCLFYSVFSSLHALFAAMQCCSLGQLLAPGTRDAMWAARLASEPLREITLTPTGVAVAGKDGGWLCSSDLLTYTDSRLEVTPESQCLFSTNTRQQPNSWTLSEHQDVAHCSAIF